MGATALMTEDWVVLVAAQILNDRSSGTSTAFALQNSLLSAFQDGLVFCTLF